MNRISVVIPVFNSELSIENLCFRLLEVLDSNFSDSEIILVDDRSIDSSWAIISTLAQNNQRIRSFRLSRNYGQHNALLCGIRAARFETVITMDDDGQNPPSEIPKLVEKYKENFDVVYGTPGQQRHGLLRNLASSMTKIALQNVMGADTARHVSAFRIFKTRLRDGFKIYRSPFVSIDVMLTWSTSNFGYVEVEQRSREAGASNYTVGKLISHAFNLVTGFSSLPLQVASLIGFIFTLFGLGVLIWVLASFLVRGTSVAGFPFLASIIAIFSGVQLFALGIFGEYLARIHFRTMDRPAYVIDENIDCLNSDTDDK